ncbi:MAG: FAD-dependent oxidoreductase [Isosphaeraceae bacterium]|nr:FAD-dependent oxidoreductase [Isosphaeraceae bacterium]
MYDLAVLGGGSGGLSVARAAAQIGAKVALIEKHHLGGECTLSACVPSKALVQAARVAHLVRTSDRFGVKTAPADVDFAAVMNRIRAVVADFAGDGSGESLRARGIDVYRGSAAFTAYDTVLFDGKTRIEAERFVIATGSRPAIPHIPGLADVGYLTNVSVWELTERPSTLIVLGAGPNGVEFAQAFARLGVHVKLLADSDRILPGEDPEVSELVRSHLDAEGLVVKTGVELTRVFLRDGQKVVAFRDRVTKDTFEAAGTHILVSTGRLPNIEGLNLDVVGVHADPEHGIHVDEHLQTNANRIYAIGDVLHRHDFTHAAEREAAVVFQNAVLRIPKKVDYTALPWATFVDPEVATVGLTESVAKERHPDALVLRARYDELDRARIDGRTEGFAKVVATPAGKVLGATVVGEDASMVLQEFVVAMEHGLTLADIARTVHTYPTYAGLARKVANQYSATRLGGGFVQSALKWFLGYRPRPDAAGEAARMTQAATTEEGSGHGH